MSKYFAIAIFIISKIVYLYALFTVLILIWISTWETIDIFTFELNDNSYTVENLKRKPGIIKHISEVGYYSGQAYYGNILLTPSYFDALSEDKVDIGIYSHLIHEKAHVEQFKEKNTAIALIRYTIDSNYQYKLELEAKEAEIKFLVENQEEMQKMYDAIIKENPEASKVWSDLDSWSHETVTVLANGLCSTKYYSHGVSCAQAEKDLLEYYESIK